MAVAAVLAYTFVVTWIIATVMSKITGIRVDPEAEHEGVDVAVHGETAYVFETPGPTQRPVEPTDAVTAAEAITESAAAKDPATS